MYSLAPMDPYDDTMGTAAFSITINATTPLWFYCSQPNHCVGGMGGSINAPPEGNTIEKYQAMAKMSGIANPFVPSVGGGTITPPNPVIHTVIAGGFQNTYEPRNFTAKPGDMVQVIMRNKNHSGATFSPLILYDWLIESSYSYGIDFSATLPASQPDNRQAGCIFWFVSVFLFVHCLLQFLYLCSLATGNTSDDSTGGFTYTFPITSMAPRWFYCSQTAHCTDGMTFSINAPPTGNHTIDDYRNASIHSGIINPVIPVVSGGVVSSSSNPYKWDYADSVAHTYAASNSASSDSESGSPDHASTTVQKAKSLAKGVLIGIVAAAVGLLLLSILAVYCCCCRKRKSRAVPGQERGEGGFMGYASPSYRSISSPAPGAGVADYEPLVPPGEKANVPHDDYHPSGAYDPPQPTALGQYSTAWDQHK